MLINDKENYDKVRETIDMSNMRKLLETNNYSVTKLATRVCISDSTVNSYLNGQKLPSVTTLVSIANYLNCNIDYLLGRTNNPMSIDKINSINSNQEFNMLINNIAALPKDKQKLVEAYVKGLTDK